MSRYVFLGDFSGLSLFLSRGLKSLGVETILYSNGDHWKNLPRSRNLWKPGEGQLASVLNQFSGFKSLLESLNENDTLVVATEFIFNRATDGYMLGRLAGRAGRVVLLHAGCSDRFYEVNRSTQLCLACKAHDLKTKNCKFERQRWPFLEGALKKIDTVVPFTSAYAQSALGYPIAASNVTDPIHFPIDIDYLQSLSSNSRAHKPDGRALHGTNRVGFKGTVFLQELMKLDRELSELVNITPRMQFTEFLGVLVASGLLIDQLFANGYGMSGALSLALGVPVLFGYTTASVSPDFVGPGITPVKITGNTQFDVLALKEAILSAISNAPTSDELKAFAHERHDHVEVARQFLARLVGRGNENSASANQTL